MRRHMGHEGPTRQGSRENAVLSPHCAAALRRLFIILNHLSPLWSRRFRLFAPRCFHAIIARAHFLRLHPCGIQRSCRDPRLHHSQPGGRLRRRPVPGQKREMRRTGRAYLLPVTRFCPGFGLSPGRSRRNYRLCPQIRRKLLPWPLRRICRNHLPALNSLGTGVR
jgi:hypothetical protein